jgi:hypothetical protein
LHDHFFSIRRELILLLLLVYPSLFRQEGLQYLPREVTAMQSLRWIKLLILPQKWDRFKMELHTIPHPRGQLQDLLAKLPDQLKHLKRKWHLLTQTILAKQPVTLSSKQLQH